MYYVHLSIIHVGGAYVGVKSIVHVHAFDIRLSCCNVTAVAEMFSGNLRNVD